MIPPQLMHRLEYSNSQFTLSNDPMQISSVVAHLQMMLRCLPLPMPQWRLLNLQATAAGPRSTAPG